MKEKNVPPRQVRNGTETNGTETDGAETNGTDTKGVVVVRSDARRVHTHAHPHVAQPRHAAHVPRSHRGGSAVPPGGRGDGASQDHRGRRIPPSPPSGGRVPAVGPRPVSAERAATHDHQVRCGGVSAVPKVDVSAVPDVDVSAVRVREHAEHHAGRDTGIWQSP